MAGAIVTRAGTKGRSRRRPFVRQGNWNRYSWLIDGPISIVRAKVDAPRWGSTGADSEGEQDLPVIKTSNTCSSDAGQMTQETKENEKAVMEGGGVLCSLVAADNGIFITLFLVEAGSPLQKY